MEFKKFSAGTTSFGKSVPKMNMQKAKEMAITNVNFEDDLIKLHLTQKTHPNNWYTLRMMEILSVCHTVVVEEKNGKLTYNASSPDELALVNGAKYLGYNFKRRDEEDNVIIENSILNREERFQLLNVIEFNSTRKRMTVIVRNPEGKIIVMCKGADSIILPLLRKDSENVENTISLLEMYSREGLRTLLLAQKEINEHEYNSWNMKY